MTQQRYHSLDFLRASMMFLGVVLHGAQMYMAELTTDDYYLDPMRSLSMDVILVIINTFRMPVFFFLSGFFVALLYEKRGLSAMLNNRLRRISLPFVVLLPPVGLLMAGLTILGANWLQTQTLSFELTYIDNPFKLVDKTHNMWFLYYLTMHFITAALLITVWKMWGGNVRNPLTVVVSRINPWVFIALLSVALALVGAQSDTGRITASVIFAPDIEVYLYFGVCFSFGWAMYYSQALIQFFEKNAWRITSLAWGALIVSVVFFALLQGDSAHNFEFHCALSLFSGVSVSCFIAGFIGLFQRYYPSDNPRVRYFSDSAYWVFIAHSFFLVLLAIPMAHFLWPAEIKFAIVVSGATWLSLLTYKHCVRSTWLGELLNGKRYSD